MSGSSSLRVKRISVSVSCSRAGSISARVHRLVLPQLCVGAAEPYSCFIGGGTELLIVFGIG